MVKLYKKNGQSAGNEKKIHIFIGSSETIRYIPYIR